MNEAEILAKMERQARAFQASNETPLGFKLLYCPAQNLVQHNGLLVLGLNPGGGPHDEQLDEPDGISYEVGRWARENPGKARLQEQGMTLLRHLRPTTFRNSVVSNVCVFRSAQWTRLETYRYEAFVKEFWEPALRAIEPFRLVVFISAKARALGKSLFPRSAHTASWTRPVWGNASVRYFAGAPGNGVPHVLELPHLSRFRFVSAGDERWESIKPLLADLVE